MDRPPRYDSDGLPLSFGAPEEQGKLPPRPSASKNETSASRADSTSPKQFQSPKGSKHLAEDHRDPTSAMNQNPTFPSGYTDFDPSTHQADSTLSTHEADSNLSTHQADPNPRATASLPIPIRQSHKPADDPLTVPLHVGRPPPKDRNKLNLTVSTSRYNPFLHPTPASTPMPGSRAESTVPTPVPTPSTTPGRSMIFPMESDEEREKKGMKRNEESGKDRKKDSGESEEEGEKK